MSATWPHGDPNVVVRSVLQEPAFRTAMATSHAMPARSPFDIALAWFVEHVVRPLFPRLAHALGATHDAGTVAGVTLVVLSIIGLAYGLVRVALAFVRQPAARPEAGTVSLRSVRTRSAAAWRDVAAEAAAAGDFARAIAALFAAALATLDARGLIAFDAARTPGEYRRLVRRLRRDAGAPFDELCERYVRAAYAAVPAEASDFAAAARAFGALEPALHA